MRNKGAIAAICFIMILGVLFTAATRRFVSERVGDGLLTAKSAQSGGFAAAESAQSGAFAAAQAAQNGISAAESERSGSPAAGGPFGAQAEANAAPEAGMAEAPAAAEDRAAAEARMEAGEPGKAAAEDRAAAEARMEAGEPGKAAAEDTAAAPAEASVLQEADGKAAGDGSAIISPLSGAAPGTAAAGIRTEEEFRRRLEEVDELVESRRDSDAATAESLRRQADYEFRLWEEERSRIVQAILGVLGDEEAAAFQSAEQEWLRERDVTARQAAGRFAGGAMEELEYTASLAVTTRERAYALLDGYGSVLPREETQSAAG